MEDWNLGKSKSPREADAQITVETETESTKDKGVYVGTDDVKESGESSDTNSDGLGDIWNQMIVALECSKDAPLEALHDEYDAGDQEDCDHSFILKDDNDDVCRICGLIKR